MYVLNLSMEIAAARVPELNDVMEETLHDTGAVLLGSGYGFGWRDYQYGFTKPISRQLVIDLKKLFPDANIVVGEHDDADYGE